MDSGGVGCLMVVAVLFGLADSIFGFWVGCGFGVLLDFVYFAWVTVA